MRGWIQSIIAILLSLSVPAPRSPLANRHSGRALLMGSYILVFDDMRLLFHAGMSAGDFFDQLERRKTAEGEQFLIHNRPVGVYPDSVRVDLFGAVSTSGETTIEKRYPGTAAALMDSLRIKAEWKTGLDVRPVSKVSIKRLNRDVTAPIILWRYQLDVSAEAVPLTDHLVVTVYGPDNQFVARFSARP